MIEGPFSLGGTEPLSDVGPQKRLHWRVLGTFLRGTTQDETIQEESEGSIEADPLRLQVQKLILGPKIHHRTYVGPKA